jgi:hypothetical protein
VGRGGAELAKADVRDEGLDFRVPLAAAEVELPRRQFGRWLTW